MKTHLIAAVASLAAACLFQSVALAGTQTWTGAGDGKTFASAANWSPASIPSTTSDCIIPAGATTVRVGGSVFINSLSTARNMLLDGCATVSLKAGMTLSSDAVVTIDNTGGCTGFLFDGGTQSISGSGAIVVTSAGNSGNIFEIRSNAAITMGPDITLAYGPGTTGSSAQIYVAVGCSFTNLGKISLTRPAATLSILGPGTFTNSNKLYAQTGALRIETANWSSSGLIQVLNAQLFVAGIWANTGSVSLNSAAWNVGGTYSDLGTVQRTGGAIALTVPPSGATLAATAATGNLVISGLSLTGKSLVASGGSSFVSDGTLSLSNCSLSGTLNACGTVVISNSLSLSGGLITFAGCSYNGTLRSVSPAQEISGSGEINLRGELALNDSSTLTLGPGITLRDPIQIALPSGSTLTNNGALIRTLGGSFPVIGTGTLTNAGSFETALGTTLTMQVSNWSNSGTMTFKGAAVLSSSATWSNTNLLVFEGPSVTIEGAWTNSGTLESRCPSTSIAGLWSNNGLLKLTNSTTSLNGTYPGFGQLERSGGTLTLDGICSTPLLEANVLTGPIALGAVQLQNCTIRATADASLSVTGSSVLTACTIASPLPIKNCGNLIIASSLTLANDAAITVNRTGSGCEYALRFSSGVIPVQGTGTIEAISDTYLISTTTGSTVTFNSGIKVLIGSAFTQSAAYFLNSGTLINKGLLRLERAATTLSILGGTFRNQGQLDIRAGKFRIDNLAGSLGSLTLGAGTAADIAGTSYSINLSPVVAPGATLTFSGKYVIGLTFSLADANIEFRGNWTNNSTMSFTRSNVRLVGTWSNNGSLNVTDSNLTLGGAYPGLGTHQFANVRTTYSDTLPTGITLTADASTGDIGLEGVTLNSATLRTLDGAKFYFTSHGEYGWQGSLLTGCTFDGDISAESCNTVRISGGLALTSGTRVLLGAGCNGGFLFEGSPQSISGSGEFIALGSGGSSGFYFMFNVRSVLTMESGITIRIPPSSPGPGTSKIYIETGRFINRGTILMQAPGREFYILGRLDNQGLIEASAGTMRFDAYGLENLKNFKLTGGTWRALNAPFNFEGPPIRSIGPGTDITLEGPLGLFQQMTNLASNEGTLRIRSRTQSTAPIAPAVFTNSGTLDLSSSAAFTVTGPAAFAPGSILRTEVAGLDSGMVGKLSATGAVSLAGALQGSFASAYIPLDGDITSAVIESPHITGSFASTCFDSNSFGLGVLPLFEAGPPDMLSLQISQSAGVPAMLLHGPADTSATPSVTFYVDAWPLNIVYQWKRDGEVLIDGPTSSGSIISGANSSELSVLRAQPADVGEYTVTVSTPCSSVTSDPALLRFCYGDFNSDVLVDDLDFSYFAFNYNIMDCADPLMPHNCPGDFNSDGVVDDSDFSTFVLAYDTLVCPQLSICSCHMPAPPGPHCRQLRCP